MQKGTAGGGVDDLQLRSRDFRRMRLDIFKKTAQRLFGADPSAQPFDVSFLMEQGREGFLFHRMQPLPAQGRLTLFKDTVPQMLKIQHLHLKTTAD
jgi:hypothetical protein